MSKICYVDKRFTSKSLSMIEQVNEIIVDYQQQGFSLTLRQLYYQFVSRDLIPNKQTEYKRLGSILNDARLAGLVDWDAIEDRTRNLNSYHFDNGQTPQNILEVYARSFELDKWHDQDNYVEVWIEKDALAGVISGVCEKWRVPYFACRGYTSQSEQWAAGQRFADKLSEGKEIHVLHLGDHDPSGIDMTRDNRDRLNMFTDGHGEVNVHRLALNMEQVRKYNPPPNPAKDTDIRFEGYVKKFGRSSWELDALEPKIISSIVGEHIESFINQKAWKKSIAREDREKKVFLDAAKKV